MIKFYTVTVNAYACEFKNNAFSLKPGHSTLIVRECDIEESDTMWKRTKTPGDEFYGIDAKKITVSECCGSIATVSEERLRSKSYGIDIGVNIDASPIHTGDEIVKIPLDEENFLSIRFGSHGFKKL